MAGNPVFSRKASIFIKAQAGEGVAAAPGVNDGILVEIQNNPFKLTREAISTNEARGTLNASASIPGGLKVEIPGQVLLRGTSTPGTLPDWAVIMTMSMFNTTATAAPVPVAPAALADGSALTVTLGADASGTAQAYRGMPLLLDNNSGVARSTFVTDYAATKVATLTDDLTAAVPDETWDYQVLKNVRFASHSDVAALPFFTTDLYVDGMRIRLIDARARIDGFDFPTGGVPRLRFTIMGMSASPLGAVANPPAAIADATFDPPIFRGGVFQIDRAPVGIKTLSINPGMELQQFEDPNATEGFGAAIPTARKWQFSIDPMDTLANTVARINAFQAGGRHLIHAHWGATPGNRLAVTIPAGQYLQLDPQDDRGGLRGSINGECVGGDGEEFIFTIW